MPGLSVTLKAVTPIFLTGADNQTPELRAPSFRGVLRYWLRALLGAGLGSNLAVLRSRESMVFGSTGGASPVVVRVADTGHLIRAADEDNKRRVLPHSSSTGKQFSNPAYAEGSQFELTLATRPGQQKLPDEAIAALLLLVNLGGVGKRSRRGFGSLQAVAARYEDQSVVALLSRKPVDGADLEQHLRAVLREAQDLADVAGGAPYGAEQIPDYPVLTDAHARVLVCRHAFPVGHYHHAMVDFWNRLRKPEYASGSRQDAFGYVKGKKRRASPLLLHIAQSQAGHHLVMTAFRSKPEPLGSEGWEIVQRFLDESAEAWDGVYLLGGGAKW